MSAFIVENKTINRILSFLYWDNGISDSWNKRILDKVGFSVETEKEQERLGKAMLIMNCRGVSQRYNEKQDAKIIKSYKFVDVVLKDRQEIQVLKSLQCFLYQCCEGDTDTLELYKALKEIEVSLLNSIVDKLPEYEKAIWG